MLVADKLRERRSYARPKRHEGDGIIRYGSVAVICLTSAIIALIWGALFRA